MTLPAFDRPWWMTAINRLGRSAPRRPSLAPHALMQAARRKTGQTDFGEEPFEEGLTQLCSALDTEAELHSAGRLMTRQQLVGDLSRRLRVLAWRQQHPSVAEEVISAPLFIVGLPRSGTTLLFNLLAQDPAHRTPLTWELEDPCPPPRTETFFNDPRIARCHKRFAQLDRLCPRLRAIHEMDAELPQECVALTGWAFQSVQFFTLYNIPGYQQWLDRQDTTPGYVMHRQILQHLQSGHRGERWILKSPGNLANLETIFRVYPDARVIHTHRSTAEIMPSLASLTWTLRQLYSDRVDAHRIGTQVVDLWAEHLRRAMQARDRLAAQRNQFFDLHYADFVRDPIGWIQTLYAHFDLPFSGIAHQRMKSYLQRRPQGHFGAHRYTPADFGLAREPLLARFADYHRRFDVPV